MQADEHVAAELYRFRVAVERRFGEEGVRAMLRGRAGAVTATSVAPGEQRALDEIAGLTVTLQAGERAGVAVARQAERQRQGQRLGLGR